MKLTFYGAAQQVTGSMFMLELADGYQMLIDCGLSYERKQNLKDNANFTFDPETIDLVIITHAHIDHSGNLPTLIKYGFSGQVLCTMPTMYLMEQLLFDSAGIQAGKLKKGHKQNDERKLFGYKEVQKTIERVVTISFNQPFEIKNGLSVTFTEAGHILGAASVVIEVAEQNKSCRIGFTGDLGTDNNCLIVPPNPMKNLDYMVMESTYGSRFHKDMESAEDILLKHIKASCVDKPGRLIIPAFSIGRTQAILFTLNKLFRSGRLPKIRIFADSPLAMSSSAIHDKFIEYLNTEAKAFFTEYHTLFDFKQVYAIEDREEKEELNLTGSHLESMIIVSSAGMMDGGRIQEHIKNNIQNTLCTVLVAGFCTPGSLGYDLMQGKSTVAINKRELSVYARITSTDTFSAHPDQTGLLSYFGKVKKAGHLKKVFLVHGEAESIEIFKDKITETGFENVVVPKRAEYFFLD